MQLAGNLLHTKYHYSRIPTKSEKTGAYISYNFECHYPEQEKSSYINCNIVPNISGQGQVPHALKFPIFLYLPDRMPRQKRMKSLISKMHRQITKAKNQILLNIRHNGLNRIHSCKSRGIATFFPLSSFNQRIDKFIIKRKENKSSNQR